MSNLNGINQQDLYRINIQKPSKKTVEDTSDKQDVSAAASSQSSTPVSPDQVYDYYNQSAALQKASITGTQPSANKSTIKVSDYVTPEQAQRISQSAVQGYAMLASMDGTAKSLGLSDSAAQTATLAAFHNKYMPQ